MLGRVLFREASTLISQQGSGLSLGSYVDDALASQVEAAATRLEARYAPLFDAGLQLLETDCNARKDQFNPGRGGESVDVQGGQAPRARALPCRNLLALHAAQCELGRWHQIFRPPSPGSGRCGADCSPVHRAAAAILCDPCNDAAWADLFRIAATLGPEARNSLEYAVKQGRESLRRGLRPRWACVHRAASTALAAQGMEEEGPPPSCCVRVRRGTPQCGRNLVATCDVAPGEEVAVERARAVAPLSPVQRDSRCGTCLAPQGGRDASCPTPAACWLARLQPVKGADPSARPAQAILGLRTAAAFPPRVQLALTTARAGGTLPQWPQEAHVADQPRRCLIDALAWTAAALSVERHIWGSVRAVCRPCIAPCGTLGAALGERDSSTHARPPSPLNSPPQTRRALC